MTIARAPGDTSPKQVRMPGEWKLEYPGATIVDARNNVFMEDKRPSYSYGTVSNIGDRVWRNPTEYHRYNREVKADGISRIRERTAMGNEFRQSETNPDIFNIVQLYGGIYYDVIDEAMKYNTRSASQVKALNKIADQKANLGESLATYNQTVRMFGSKASKLRDALYAFKHGRFKKYLYRSARDIRRSGDKYLAELYLEYVYGWKPLLSDIYGIHQILKEYAAGMKPVIIHGHGSQKQETSYQGFPKQSQWTASYTVEEKVRSSCDLYGRLNPDYAAFRILNQMGLLNPASFIWDITPWSFVVDWFIPIGPTLSAFTAPVGVDFISGTTATRSSRSIEGKYHQKISSDPYEVLEDTPIDFTVTDEAYSRIVHSTWPFPTPYLNLNPLAGDRWLKALALSIVNLKR